MKRKNKNQPEYDEEGNLVRPTKDLHIDESQLSEEETEEMKTRVPVSWIVFISVIVALIIACIIVICILS